MVSHLKLLHSDSSLSVFTFLFSLFFGVTSTSCLHLFFLWRPFPPLKITASSGHTCLIYLAQQGLFSLASSPELLISVSSYFLLLLYPFPFPSGLLFFITLWLGFGCLNSITLRSLACEVVYINNKYYHLCLLLK